MATVTQQQAKGRRHRKSDPFLHLSDDTPQQPAQPSPDTKDRNSHDLAPRNVLADLILTPIHVISFIVSLFLVDRQQRQWRLAQHAPPESSYWGQFAFKSPEPYQEARGTTWHPRLSWRRRGVAKVQMNSVLELRATVIVALVAWTLFGFLAVAYAARQMYHWVSV